MKQNLIIFVILLYSIQLKAQKSAIEISGDFLSVALPVAAYASTQIWKDDQKAGWQFAGAMATSFVLTHSLKRIIDKERPNGGRYSFPSGHTSSAFTGAAFIQRRYGWKAGIPLYLLASYVGWTRIHENKHDYWDVFGGAVIGIGSAYIFARPYNNQEQKSGEVIGTTLFGIATAHLFARHATKHKIDLSYNNTGDYHIFNLSCTF